MPFYQCVIFHYSLSIELLNFCMKIISKDMSRHMQTLRIGKFHHQFGTDYFVLQILWFLAAFIYYEAVGIL